LSSLAGKQRVETIPLHVIVVVAAAAAAWRNLLNGSCEMAAP